MSDRPLVVHLIYKLAFGGLEVLLAECINRMPQDRYRHAIVCLTDYTEFRDRIHRVDVEVYALHKPPGLAPGIHVKLWRLLRRLRPAILHTYNLSALEYSFTATLAGVPIRIHAVHGREMSDPEGMNRKHNLLRKALIPFNHCFVPVSADLQLWLRNVVGVPEVKNMLIHNGVDTEVFRTNANDAMPEGFPFSRNRHFIIGTVGRAQDIKNQASLIDAFVLLQRKCPESAGRLRLAIVGDGPLLEHLRSRAKAHGIERAVWLPGARADIPSVLAQFSVFALPSIAEGTPVAVLEAMSAGLPVIASRVGGLPEVVAEGVTGTLCPVSDVEAWADALAFYLRHPEAAGQHGRAGRQQVEVRNSTRAMVNAYLALYDRLLYLQPQSETSPSCAE